MTDEKEKWKQDVSRLAAFVRKNNREVQSLKEELQNMTDEKEASDLENERLSKIEKELIE